jgi:hypothetical protein
MGYYLRRKREWKMPFRRIAVLRRKLRRSRRDKSRKKVVTGGYCLYCFHAPLDASHRCDECGKVSLRSLRVEYWNQHPRLKRWEKLGKLFAALGLPVIVHVVMNLLPGEEHPGGPGFCLLPLLVAAGMWKTMGKLTRNDPYFRPSILWGLTTLGLGIACLTFDWRWSVGFVGLAFVVLWWSVMAQRWKLRLMGVLDE